MSRSSRWMLVLAVVAAVPFSACGKVEPSASVKVEPVKLEKIEGDLGRLTFEPQAAQRIGIKTHKVSTLTRFDGEAARLTVPYAAVLYDAQGNAYVYTTSKHLVFDRHPVTIDYIEGDTAVLLDGPRKGTSVVTTGGAELAGVEFGVGK